MAISPLRERVPTGALAADVEVVRISRFGRSQPFDVKTCPNGTPGLVYQSGEDGLPIVRIATRSSLTQPVPGLFLHGQGLEPSVMSFSGHPGLVVQVVLKPHGLTSVFGVPGADLALKSRLPEEFGAQSLSAALQAASTDQGLFDAVEAFLAARKATAGRRDLLVERILALVLDDPGIRTGVLADRLFLSVRQLQRRFLRTVGCPLKSYQRLRRANLALALLQEREDRPLSEIAHQLDYADQSHFIRDIKEFTWLVPGRLRGVWEVNSRDGVGFSYVARP